MSDEHAAPPRAPTAAGSTATLSSVDVTVLGLLIDSVSDYAIFVLDPQGHVASWNTGAARMKGYRVEDIVGRHFSVFYPPDAVARDWPAQELEAAARDGRFEDEGWRVRKDGTQFWANVVITAVRDREGRLVAFGKVTRDITERKAHEERIQALTRELQQRIDELAAANRELAQQGSENESFVYSVSHDLRSPLVNLQGFSQELELASEALKSLFARPSVPPGIRTRGLQLLDTEFAESIQFIRNAVRHLGNIIDGLLRLSRIGRVEYQSEPVHVREVVADILPAMHTSILASGARIELGDLPIVRGDRNAIGQIFANLVGNALKSFADGTPGVVEIAATHDDPPVFMVRDTGVGIPAEYRAKIFKVFQRVHHDTKSQGEGMGLAIVRRIVERHGGRIWFESAAGQGTTFFFTLGAALPSAPAGSAPESDG